MSMSKFIIGLGTSLPSTRVLKPPGGDSSDLFGLKSRQEAAMQSIKKASFAATSNKFRELIAKSMKCEKNPTSVEKVNLTRKSCSQEHYSKFENTENNVDENSYDIKIEVKSNNETIHTIDESDGNCFEICNENHNLQRTGSNHDLRKSEGKENLLDYTKNISKETEDIHDNQVEENQVKKREAVKSRNLKKIQQRKSCEEFSKNFQSLEIKNSIVDEGIVSNLPLKNDTNKMVTKSLSKNNVDVSGIEDLQITEKQSSGRKAQNTKLTPSKLKKKSPITDHIPKGTAPKSSRNIVRNPITGFITEMNRDKLYRQLRAVGIENKAEKKRSGRIGDDLINFNCNKRNKVYVSRNPITGEGTKDDTNYFKFMPRGIRVIQPPGGVSFGIY